jgi:hypothetical protein
MTPFVVNDHDLARLPLSDVAMLAVGPTPGPQRGSGEASEERMP